MTGAVPLRERIRRWRRRHASSELLLAHAAAESTWHWSLLVPIALQVMFGFYSRELYKGVVWKVVPDIHARQFCARALASEEIYLQSLLWTVGVAFFTSALAIFAGAAGRLFSGALQPCGKSLIEVSFLLPIFGDVFTLFALAYAFAPQGPVNWLLTSLGLIQEPIQFVGSPLIVIIWMSVPTLSVLLIRSALVGVDVIYEEAAQTMGANTIRTFIR